MGNLTGGLRGGLRGLTGALGAKKIARMIVAFFRLDIFNPNASVPTQGATTFTRASKGWAFDSNGVLQEYAIDAPRQQDGGLLIEEGSTNATKTANWRLAAGYTAWGAGTSTAVNDAVGTDGVANAAVTITDNDPARIIGRVVAYNPSMPLDSNLHWVTFAVGVNQQYIPLLSLNMSGGTVINKSVFLDTATGLTAQATTGLQVIVKRRGVFWIVNLGASNNGTNFALRGIIYPCRKATLNGANDATLQGSCIVDWGQLELNKAKPSSLLPAGLTRFTDVCYTANANIPTLANGATFVWKGRLPIDGTLRTAFRSSPNHLILWRDAGGSIQAWINNNVFGTTAGVDENSHTYIIRTDGVGLNELFIDGALAGSSNTMPLQPTNPLHIGSYNGNTQLQNDTTAALSTYDRRLTDAEVQALSV